MMFNGLLTYGDSDTEFVKERASARCANMCASMCVCSARACGADAGCSCADHYRAKLLLTLEVLRNKEETVRVQADSLRVAEARIAALAERARAHRTDLQELATQKALVRSLQVNLSVMEDLYRDCFYESARQEQVVEGLRQWYLDMRAAGDRGNHTTTDFTPCQGVAAEVDSLKMEISNMLNSSNNDSGMWERTDDSFTSEVVEDLQLIGDQLLQLKAMLTGDCTCGLDDENMRLKSANEAMMIQVGELRHRVSELEKPDTGGEDCERHRRELEEQSKQLASLREQLMSLEEEVTQKNENCEGYRTQLQQVQALLQDRDRELEEARVAADRFRRDLEDCQEIILQSTRESSQAQEEVRRLAAELARATEHARRLDDHNRQQAQSACELRAQLTEALTRGAALAEHVRQAARDVKACVRRVRHTHRTQEEQIRAQEAVIHSLKERLEKRHNVSLRREDDACCSQCVSLRHRPRRPPLSEMTRCFKCARDEAGQECCADSGSEKPSCSSAPTPPKRLLRKKPSLCSIRGLSPAAELQQRAEALRAGLRACRWAHAHTHTH